MSDHFGTLWIKRLHKGKPKGISCIITCHLEKNSFRCNQKQLFTGTLLKAVLKISENSTKLSKFSKQLLCRAPLGICFSNYTEFMENICSVVAPIETGEALAHPLVFEKSNKNCKVLIYFTLVLTFTYSLNFPSYCIHDLWQRWRT